MVGCRSIGRGHVSLTGDYSWLLSLDSMLVDDVTLTNQNFSAHLADTMSFHFFVHNVCVLCCVIERHMIGDAFRFLDEFEE